MKLSDLIVTDAIIPQLAATSRDEAVAELMTALSDAGAINADSVKSATDAILAREAQATTGIGHGIAFPHARIKGVKKAVCVIGCSPEGIGFNSLDGKPVDVVLLLLSSPEDADEHLQAMETIFRHVHREAFRTELRACQTKDEMVAMIDQADQTE
jgi:mannitol/fructose-specific phosphotransferase system IIA component (Ntr-type)